MSSLLIFSNDCRVGRIDFDGIEDKYQLTYDPDWIQKNFPLSPHLTATSAPTGAVKRYLANLLPEGRWLEELSLESQLSKSNIFGLVGVLGHDTASGVMFAAEGEAPMRTTFREIPYDELRERVSERRTRSITFWDGKPRLSVAGVQEKLPLLIRGDGTYGFGEGALASTHLLKFDTAEVPVVINEYICMTLAQRIGLPVAEVELMRLDEPVLVVRRFDRTLRDDSVERIHVIDGCQVLDLPPTYKYERPLGSRADVAGIRDGATLAGLFSACRSYCAVPAAGIRDLLNWVLFQILIGNSDAHGKNISFIVTKRGLEVAPAYDLLNIRVYCEKIDSEFAMAIGDAFTMEALTAWEMAEMCQECKLQPRHVARTLLALIDKLRRVVKEPTLLTGLQGTEIDLAQQVLDDVDLSCKRVATIARDLPQIRL